MNIFGSAAELSRPRWGARMLVSLLGLALMVAIRPQNVSAYQDAPAPPQGAPPSAPAPPYTQGTPEQLQQLVAPIALYPDSLVAQILAASTFPGASCRGRPMGARASGFKGRRFGPGGGPTTLGRERQGAYGISIGPGKYGQEPLLDVIARRRILQPATGCDGCRAGNASAGGKGWGS